MCCRSLRRLSTSMPPGGATPRACRPEGGGTRSCDPKSVGSGRGISGLRRAQGLAAARPGRDRGGALHDRPADATDGAVGRDPRQSNKDDDRQSRRTLPARQEPAPAKAGVNRQFRGPRPNALWVADFTDVATWQGFVYVAFVIDAFARRIVGWRVSRSAETGFVLDALEQALYVMIRTFIYKYPDLSHKFDTISNLL